MLIKGEVWLVGSHISPLPSASTHVNTKPDNNRKLLLTAKELKHLIGSIERKGNTLVPLDLHWKKHLVKVSIALAKGKSHLIKEKIVKKEIGKENNQDY